MKVLRRSALHFAAGVALAALGGTATAQTGPFQYFAVTPCRAVDTRTSSPVTNAAFASFTIKGICNVPSDAVAASLNVTVVGPTAAGFLGIWPTGLIPPNVSTINFPSGEPAIANGAIVPLGAPSTNDISI